MSITVSGYDERVVSDEKTPGPVGANYQGAVWGSTIPISSGFRAIDGAVIWAGQPYKDDVKVNLATRPTAEGIANVTWEQTWLLKRTFAVSLGKRLNPNDDPPSVRRVWADGALIYSNGTGSPLSWGNTTQTYYPNGTVLPGGVVSYNDDFTSSGQGDIGPTFQLRPQAPVSSLLTFRFYDGSEDQLPDPAIVAALGDLAPAFRGLMYMVIEGLVVGKGSNRMENYVRESYSNGDQIIALVENDTVNQQSVDSPNFPQMRVELVDQNTTTSSIHDFQMLPGSVPLRNPDHVLVADYSAREIYAFSSLVAGGGHLHVGDLDTKEEKEFITITGAGTQQVGDNFFCYDALNKMFYTGTQVNGLGNQHPYVSVSRAGALIDLGMGISNNDPENIDLTTITDAKPAIRMPYAQMGCIGYAIVSNEIKPVLFAGNVGHAGMLAVSAAGDVPDHLYPRSIVDIGPFQLQSCQALPLLEKGLNERVPFQDMCFLISGKQLGIPSLSGYVDLIYVGLSTGPDGSKVPFVRGTVRLFTASAPTSNVCALIDQDSNILVQERTGAGVTLLSKFIMDYTVSPDFSVAAGWQGVFPKFVTQSVSNFASGENYVWDGDSIRNSDLSAGTMSIWSSQLLDLRTLKVTSVTLGAASGFTNFWDSKQQVRFFHGTLADSGFGHGLRFGQVYYGSDGHINTLQKYLQDICVEAGFSLGDVDVDANLVDQVPGTLFLKAYDLNQLFSDIGVMYDFTFYNSGGKMRFRKNNIAPKKATGTVTVTADPADGDTLTIGTTVYRFKNTPVAPFDVKIGVDSNGSTDDSKEKTCANLLAAIMADITLASDAGGFYTGTVINPFVTAAPVLNLASVYGSVALTLTAIIGGTSGNSIALNDTSAGITRSGNFLSDGSDPPASARTIDIGDMMNVDEDHLSEYDSLITSIAPKGTGQKAAGLAYYALEQDYAPLTQIYRPDNQGGTESDSLDTTTYSLPFVMSTSEAYLRAGKAVFAVGGSNAVTQKFRLPQSFLLLEPSDIVTITVGTYQYQVRLDECTLNGDYSTSYSAANFSFRNDIAIADSDSQSTIPQTVPSPSDGTPVVLDTTIQDPRAGTSAGFFLLQDGILAYATGFGQGSLTSSKVVGGTVAEGSEVFTTSRDVKWGLVSGSLPAATEPYMRTLPDDSITIVARTLTLADFANADDYTSWVGGQNAIYVGSPGNWELIYFNTVEQLTSKTFKLTGLIRGQRGTEPYANSHGTSDIVVLAASASQTFTKALQPEVLPVDLVGDLYQYNALGIPTAGVGQIGLSVTYAGLSLYPFAPGLMTATLNVGGANNVGLTWVRRDRCGFEFVTTAQPMSEASELYELEIMSGSTVVRTVTGLTSPAYTYTAANQTTDGFTPPLATLKVRVYQVGELGRGFRHEETLNVN